MKNYWDSPLINASTLKKFTGDLDPAIAKHELLHPKPPSEAMTLGTLVHDLMENEGIRSDKFVISPFPDFRTKAAKEWKKEMLETGRVILPEPVREQAEDMAAAISMQAPAWMFTGEYSNEQAFYTDKYKCLCDRVHHDRKAVIDWKTTRARSAREFTRECVSYGYYLQASFYLRVTGLNEFWFVAVSSVAPYPVWTFKASEQALAYGKQQWEKALENLENSRPEEAGYWEELEAPRWFEESVEDVFEI